MAKSTTKNINMVNTIFNSFSHKTETPTKETITALLEAEKITQNHDIKGYHDVDNFFAELDS